MSLALIYCDGFDSYTSAASDPATFDTLVAGKWAIATGTGQIGKSYGRNGGCGTRLTAGGITKTLVTPLAQAGIAGAVRITTPGSTDFGVGLFASDTNKIVTLTRQADGSVVIDVISRASYSTGAGALLDDGLWHHVELQVGISTSTGTLDLFVDGMSVLSQSGINTTRPGAAADIAAITYDGVTGAAVDLDDAYGYDASAKSGSETLGDLSIATLWPDGDGTGDVGTWSISGAATAAAAVNERGSDGDTSYLSDSTVGDIKTFTLSDLTYSPGTVIAVAVNAVVKNDGTGTPSAATLSRSGTTNGVGSSVATTTTYTTIQSIHARNPDTSAAWNRLSINAMEAGVTVAA